MNLFLDLFFYAYTGTLLVVVLYCFLQLHLLWQTRKAKQKPVPGTQLAASELPFVTVQLPIFNEKYVVERLIDAVAMLDYPKDRFEIHVLDDSTDETVDIVRRKVAAGFSNRAHPADEAAGLQGGCPPRRHEGGTG